MTKSVIQSFSYDVTEMATVTMAEDKAKEQGKSFSKYILELIKEDLEKKEKALLSMPILGKEYQIATCEYKPHLYNNDHEQKKLWSYLDKCDNNELTSFAIQVNTTHRKIINIRNTQFSKSKYNSN